MCIQGGLFNLKQHNILSKIKLGKQIISMGIYNIFIISEGSHFRKVFFMYAGWSGKVWLNYVLVKAQILLFFGNFLRACVSKMPQLFCLLNLAKTFWKYRPLKIDKKFAVSIFSASSLVLIIW